MGRRSASRTAQSVGLGIVFASHDPDLAPIVAPGAVEPIRACLHRLPGLLGAMYRRIERAPWLGIAQRKGRKTLPGGPAHLVARKHWIEGEVRAAIDDGALQVVVVGAGFDPLTYRLQGALPDVAFWELDLPATQRIKREALEALGPHSIRFIGVDLATSPLDRTLTLDERFSPDRPTVLVAEGLLMYLEETEVITLLDSIRRLLRGGGVMIGSSLTPGPGGRLAIAGAPRTMNWRLWMMGEPFRFGIAAEHLPGFVQNIGFAECVTTTSLEALRAALGDRPVPPDAGDVGEYFFRLRWPPVAEPGAEPTGH